MTDETANFQPAADAMRPTASGGARLELRVLAGLLAGAALPLVRDEISIGADDSCDVLLLDPGVPAHPVVLRRTGEGWHDDSGQAWPLGVARAVGEARLAICEIGAPAIQSHALSPDVAGEALPAPASRPPATAIPVAVPLVAERPDASPARRRVLLAVGLGMVILCVVGLAAVGFGALLPDGPASPVRSSGPPPPPAQQLEQMARDLLRQRDLDPAVRALAQTGVLRLEGRVEQGDLPKVDEVLATLRDRFGKRVLVEDAVIGLPSDPPLQVREFVIGPATHVTLVNGRIVFEGQQIDGLWLTRSAPSRLAFVPSREAGS